MKPTGYLGFLLLLALLSCKRDPLPQPPQIKMPETSDYRDAIIGQYSGIRVVSSWVNATVGFSYDTSSVILTLTKSPLDSLVELSFTPEYSASAFSFKFHNGLFTSTSSYHAPGLMLNNDSLLFHHQPGLGPYWSDCYTLKTP